MVADGVPERMDIETQYNSKEASADRLATASLVMGILSLVSILCCCPFIFSAIGIVLALLSKGAESVLRPRAKTGLILSVVGMVVSVVLIAFTVVFPIFMYRTNPEFRKNINNELNRSLKQDEQLIRSIYGDDVYDQMQDLFNNLEEESL